VPEVTPSCRRPPLFTTPETPRSAKSPSRGAVGLPWDDGVAQKRAQGGPGAPRGGDFCRFPSFGDEKVPFAKLLPRLSESSLLELLGDPGGALLLFLAPRGSQGGVPGGPGGRSCLQNGAPGCPLRGPGVEKVRFLGVRRSASISHGCQTRPGTSRESF